MRLQKSFDIFFSIWELHFKRKKGHVKMDSLKKVFIFVSELSASSTKAMRIFHNDKKIPSQDTDFQIDAIPFLRTFAKIVRRLMFTNQLCKMPFMVKE